MSWLYIPEFTETNLPKSLCSAEAAENSCLASGSRDGVPSAMLNTINQRPKTSSGESETDFWMMLQSGMMSQLLTAVRGAGLTWLRRASLASPSPLQASSLALPTLETCGLTPSASFVKLDRGTSSWKTCRGLKVDKNSASNFSGYIVHSLGRHGVVKSNLSSSLPTSDEYSQTWPKAGLMLDGVCYPLPKWEQRINEIGYGLWPTVKTSEADKDSRTVTGAINEVLRGKGPSLSATVVAMFPTPNTLDSLPPTSAAALAHEATVARPGRSQPANLRDVVGNAGNWPEPEQFPTPNVPNGGRQAKLENLTMDGNTLRRKNGEKAQMDLNTYVRMWPTPRANENGEYQYDKGDPEKPRATLLGAVRQFPTPRNSDGMKHKLGDGQRDPNGRLEDVIAQDVRWATPSARDWRSGLASEETMNRNSRLLSEQVVYQEELPTPHLNDKAREWGEETGGSYLNPDWVEWLMGWPIGWTAETCEIEDFLEWLYGMVAGNWWLSEPDGIPRTVSQCDNRVERIGMLGNGQVPLQAAVAAHLLTEAGEQ